MDSADVLMAMHPSSGLRAAARASLTHLNSGGPPPWDKSVVDVFHDDAHAQRLTEIFKVSGDSLTTLTLHLYSTNEDRTVPVPDYETMISAIGEHGISLHSLNLTAYPYLRYFIFADELLQSIGGRLRALTLRVYPGTGRYLVSYPKIHERTCAGLRKLSLEYIPEEGFEEMMIAAAPTLETFELIDCSVVFEYIPGPRWTEMLRKLSSISLKPENENDVSTYADMLCSYGSQLHFANIDALQSKHLPSIVNSCLNVRCDLETSVLKPRYKRFLERMTVLGSCVRSVTLGYSPYSYESSDEEMANVDDESDEEAEDANARPTKEEFIAASMACKQIEELTIYDDDPDAFSPIHGLLSSEMPILSFLDLTFSGRNEGRILNNSHDILMKIGKLAPSLRVFRYSGHAQAQGVFDALAQDVPALQQVSILFTEADLDDLNASVRWHHIQDVTISFLKCSGLQKLHVLARGLGSEFNEGIKILCRQAYLKKRRSLDVMVQERSYIF